MLQPTSSPTSHAAETSSSGHNNPRPELLAPAGDREAAWAALQYGADAIYTGVSRFSARADATNLTFDDLRAVVAYAHTLTPRRCVYVAVNTLVQERETAILADILEELDDCNVDALIIQDLGVYRLARRAFPRLRLHASTQLAVHNLAGVQALAEMGFSRVVLARELTLSEVAVITQAAPIQTEMFVHGALCYSYSGLCLFSSHQSGRSGNRGRCAYCCREGFTRSPAEEDSGQAAFQPARFPFSMRDLSLAPLMKDVINTGVHSLKIEGRMKQPLYVACVTDFYRRKLDGRLRSKEEAVCLQNIQTIFSRPWTTLYAQTPHAPVQAIIDPHFVGHRGAWVGEVQSMIREPDRSLWMRFLTHRAIEKHDGLQLELPTQGKPLGFAVDEFRQAGKKRLEISCPPETVLDVRLPPENLPEIPVGTPVFCSSSQAVKRQFPVQKPRASECRWKRPIHVQVTLNPEGLTLSAKLLGDPGIPEVKEDSLTVSAQINIPRALEPAQQSGRTEEAIRRSFTRSGDTPWEVETCEVSDPNNLFAPLSVLNDARRSLFDALTSRYQTIRDSRRDFARKICAPGAMPYAQPTHAPEKWIMKIRMTEPVVMPLIGADEYVLHMEHLPVNQIHQRLDAWTQQVAKERIRIALPLITRQHEARELCTTLALLVSEGWTRWEAADLAGIRMLKTASPSTSLDLTADWTCQGINHLARAQWHELGVARLATSPEDTQENLAALAKFSEPITDVILWQHTPLFVSETPPCLGDEKLVHTPCTWVNRRHDRFVTHQLDSRWITVSSEPFSLIHHLATMRHMGLRCFRVDLCWSPPNSVRPESIWNDLRAEKEPRSFHSGNFERGLR